MSKNDKPIDRKEMVKLLNEDLSREYQAIISYVIYSQTLKGAKYTDIAGEFLGELLRGRPIIPGLAPIYGTLSLDTIDQELYPSFFWYRMRLDNRSLGSAPDIFMSIQQSAFLWQFLRAYKSSRHGKYDSVSVFEINGPFPGGYVGQEIRSTYFALIGNRARIHKALIDAEYVRPRSGWTELHISPYHRIGCLKMASKVFHQTVMVPFHV